MLTVLERLKTIATEGKRQRDQLARDSQADRDYFRAAIAAIRNKSLVKDIVSDDEAGPSSSAGGTTYEAQPLPGSSRRLTPQTLQQHPNLMQRLRDDESTARTANGILKGAAAADETGKKLKSGYHLTINDNALVQAEWPQFNEYCSANNTHLL